LGLAVLQDSSRGFDSHHVHALNSARREVKEIALPKEVKSMLRKPLEYGYTIRKKREGRGITLLLVSPTGAPVGNIPQTAAYPDRLRDFKARVSRLPLDPAYLRSLTQEDLQAVTTITEEKPMEPTPAPTPPPALKTDDSLWITMQEAAEILGVSDGRVHQLAADTPTEKTPIHRKKGIHSYTRPSDGEVRFIATTLVFKPDVEALAIKRAQGGAGKIVPPEHRRGGKARAAEGTLRRPTVTVPTPTSTTTPAEPPKVATASPAIAAGRQAPTLPGQRTDRSGPVTVRRGEPQTEHGKFKRKAEDVITALEAFATLREDIEVLVQGYEDMAKERDELAAKLKKLEARADALLAEF
jgi:hypothetical protein